MTQDLGASSGSREPSQSALSRPIGFDPEREKAETIDGIVYVVPRFEPFASLVRGFRSVAFFIYLRWDAWGVGAQFLRAGFAVQVGPVLFGVAHIERQLAAFDNAIAMEARQGTDPKGLDGEAATARAARHRP